MTAVTPETALVAAGLSALVLSGLHLAAGRLRERAPRSERAVRSLGGGAATAYVFLHLLPEVATGNAEVGEALGDTVAPDAMLEVGLFAAALVGFTSLYAVEVLGRTQASSRRSPSWQRGATSSRLAYTGHLVTFALYNALITYTLPLRFRTGVLFAVLFVVAMALHLALTDRSLAEHYPDRFKRGGRLVLSAALLLGVAAAVVASPTRTVVVSVLTALLAGAVLLNVFKEELPASNESSLRYFAAGVTTYAALLLAVTWLEGSP